MEGIPKENGLREGREMYQLHALKAETTGFILIEDEVDGG